MIPWWRTQIGEMELRLVTAAFDHNRFSMGPVTQELENRLAKRLGVPYVILAPSGTAALTMTLMAAGVGPEDEVIVPDLTWVATAQAAEILGARTVPVDCLPGVPLMDPNRVYDAVTHRTRAIVPVHYNGRSCNMTALKQIAQEKGLSLIEDACKAFCSDSPQGKLGTLGDMGCFSFGMVSMLTMGYGGAVVTHSRDLERSLRRIRDHGVRRREPEGYLVKGFNFKVSDVLAAIGLAQLDRLDDKLEKVNTIYLRYEEGLAGLRHLVRLVRVDIDAGEVPLLIDARYRYPGEIRSYLETHGVETRPFHPPLHTRRYAMSAGSYHNSRALSEECFILPCGPGQSLDDIDRVIELIHEWERR